ncbi:MAG: hypothetical protein ABSB22_12855 [Thermodesulfobacteriota bacterium]|jgi:hypothetical protein
MKFNNDAKVIAASILALGAVTGKKSESEVMEIFKRMFSELEKIEKEPIPFSQSF